MNEYIDKEFCLEVWGENACFTRPEMKVERVSYDVITPSAARAIFEAIFWKPAFRWQITKIEVLHPIKWMTIKRNEVGALASTKVSHLFIENERQQRTSLILRDVRYRLHAKLVFIPFDKRPKKFQKDRSKDENPAKYNAMFERRASKGQCFNQPYLGNREFTASFRLVDTGTEELQKPIEYSSDFGFMLYDMDFENEKKPKSMFYRVQMNDGVIDVPDKDSEEVKK